MSEQGCTIPVAEGVIPILACKRILVSTDLSDRSLCALEYATGLAACSKARVELVYVHEPLARTLGMAWEGVDLNDADNRRILEARKYLQSVARVQAIPGVSITTHVTTGAPVAEIIRHADQEHVDLIVMAAHGSHGLAHVLMGSTTEEVVRKAPCSVLILKKPMTIRKSHQIASGIRPR